MAPKRQEDKDAREEAHYEVQREFCAQLAVGQPVAYPVKTERRMEDENSRPYFFNVAVVCAAPAPASGRGGGGGRGRGRGRGSRAPQLPAGAEAAECAPHMYMHSAGRGTYVPAVHVKMLTWTRADEVQADAVELRPCRGNPVALCSNILPVPLPGWQEWCATGAPTLLPRKVIQFVRQQTLLRWQFHSQKI